MPPLRSDATRVDALNRLACVRGHLQATAQMVERGDQDLAIVHQLHAVRGALVQIQIQLLRDQFERWANQPLDRRAFKCALEELVKLRR